MMEAITYDPTTWQVVIACLIATSVFLMALVAFVHLLWMLLDWTRDRRQLDEASATT